MSRQLTKAQGRKMFPHGCRVKDPQGHIQRVIGHKDHLIETRPEDWDYGHWMGWRPEQLEFEGWGGFCAQCEGQTKHDYLCDQCRQTCP